MKEKILQTAGEMFVSLGFKSVTMDDIANKMGISKKTIYTHFSNKTKLIEETTSHYFENMSCGIDDIINENHNPIEELFLIKNFIVENMKDEKSSPQYQLQKYYPRINDQLLKKQFSIMEDCVIKNLTHGKEENLYRSEIDENFIARIYFKGMVAIKDDETFPDDKFDRKFLLENYLDYHVRGIATAKGIQILEQLQQIK